MIALIMVTLLKMVTVVLILIMIQMTKKRNHLGRSNKNEEPSRKTIRRTVKTGNENVDHGRITK